MRTNRRLFFIWKAFVWHCLTRPLLVHYWINLLHYLWIVFCFCLYTKYAENNKTIAHILHLCNIFTVCFLSHLSTKPVRVHSLFWNTRRIAWQTVILFIDICRCRSIACKLENLNLVQHFFRTLYSSMKETMQVRLWNSGRTSGERKSPVFVA